MANTDARRGLVPVKKLDGSPYNGATIRCWLPTGESNALFIGDAVDLGGAGVSGYPSVAKATAGKGNKIFGVIRGFELDPSYLNQLHRTAATERWCYVCPANDMIFEIQASSTAVVTEASVGLNAELIFTHTGDTVTGLSGMELDTGTTVPDADATGQLTIIGLSPVQGNDITAVHAKWLVTINLPRLSPGVAGVA